MIQRGLRLAYVACVEALCPIILLAILFDSTRGVGWVFYQRDPAIYATIAWFWRDGWIPYRDIWEFKPPMIFVALRAAFALWGKDPEGLRRIFMILVTLGTLGLYAGLRRARFVIAAPVAALGLMTLVAANAWALPFQNTETLVVAFAAAAIGCAAAHQHRARWWWAVLAGACLALATMGKQPAAFFSVPLGLQLCLWAMPPGWLPRAWDVVKRGLLGASGFALVIGAFALYFAIHGAATAFYEAVLLDGARYSGNFGSAWLHLYTLKPLLWQRTPMSAKTVLQLRTMWTFIGAIALLGPLTILRPSQWAWTVTAWVWLLAAALAVLSGPCGENHYLVMVLPALALTTGVVCEVVWPSRHDYGPMHDRARLLGGVLIAFVLFGTTWNVNYFPGRGLPAGSDQVNVQAETIGQQIHAAARPGDTMLVEDEPIQLYMYAEVPPASRFIYWNAPHPRVDGDRAAALNGRPAFVVVTRGTAERLRSERASGTASTVLPWGPVLAEGYDEWLVMPTMGTVYRRRDGD